jgi:glycosyltransferase involved in cell wall biosynthesis
MAFSAIQPLMTGTVPDLSEQASSNVARRHVLYLIDRLQGVGGGAEGAVQKLCRFLPVDRFRCSVVTLGATSDIQQHFSCPVYIYPLERIYGWNAVRYGLKLSHFLRTEKVDIVHTFFPASDIWGAFVARMSGCPILISGRRDMGILRQKKHRLPYLFANRVFDQVQAVSERVREFCIEDEGFAPEKVITVENGVDLSAIDATPAADRLQALSLATSTPLVITVANLRFVKGIDVLLRAVGIVRRELPDAVFVIVGETLEPAYYRDLLRLIEQMGITRNVRLLGPRTDVFSLIKMADAFCLPSRSEGLSNALIEAMGCGVPCVATDVGGNSEVIEDGKTGFLVSSEQPQLLASRLIALLRNPGLRKGIGMAGRQTVEQRFTVQHMVDKLAVSYDQLLHARGRSSSHPVQPASQASGISDQP